MVHLSRREVMIHRYYLNGPAKGIFLDLASNMQMEGGDK